MNRDALGRVQRVGTNARDAQSPAAGKQTLAQQAESPAWQEVLRFAGVTPKYDGATSGAQQQEQGAGTPLMIQRQESNEGGIDREALHASLLDVKEDVSALVMSLDMERAMGIAEYADDGGLYQSSLRELTRRVEAIREDVQASGDADLLAQLTAVQDALVQGYQRLAISHADKTLQAWSRSTDEKSEQEEARQLDQRQRWGDEAGDKKPDWCGMFVNAQFRASGLHPQFAAAFNHTSNVMQFCTYTYSRRTPNVIIPAGTTEQIDLRTYHEQRGSLRSWKSGEEVGDDIRPGDVIIVDWGSDEDSDANHTCIVSSYTPASGGMGATVVTIDGNAFGARKPGAAMPAFDGENMTTLDLRKGTDGNNQRDLSITEWQAPAPDEGTMATSPTYRRAGSDQGETRLTIVGRGRPSVVDFELEHQYVTDLNIHEPEDPLASPLQRSETGEAKTANPSRAFAAAASGSFGEIPYREEMESRFGADFSAVQSFTGRGLDDLGALAATRGEQVVFSAGTPDRQTVAHELTHVLQSRQGFASGGKEMSDPSDASEQEARGVAASLDAGPAMASKAAISASAAPSGAIHREEHPIAPHPAHVDPGTEIWRPANWESGLLDLPDGMPEGFDEDSSAREVYNYQLLHNLKKELPEEVAAYTAAKAGPAIPPDSVGSTQGRDLRAAAVDAILAFLTAKMSTLLGQDRTNAGVTAADAIRVPLFRASQQALVFTLHVEESGRYQPERDKDGVATATYCNVFAYDMVTAMGAYLPRMWWERPEDALADPSLDANRDNTRQMTANALYQWMLDWGGAFGWRSVETPEAAQTEANQGKIVIILAGRGAVPVGEKPGHVSVVMAESEALDIKGNGDGLPVQAQAGEVNYSNSATVPSYEDGQANTATTKWWETYPHEDLADETRDTNMFNWKAYAKGYGFFVWEGGDSTKGTVYDQVTIRKPEEMGLVLPEAAAPAAESTEAAATSAP